MHNHCKASGSFEAHSHHGVMPVPSSQSRCCTNILQQVNKALGGIVQSRTIYTQTYLELLNDTPLAHAAAMHRLKTGLPKHVHMLALHPVPTNLPGL
jgi:hypothetical protein